MELRFAFQVGSHLLVGIGQVTRYVLHLYETEKVALEIVFWEHVCVFSWLFSPTVHLNTRGALTVLLHFVVQYNKLAG